jgi:PAS domain S-box-containing protein
MKIKTQYILSIVIFAIVLIIISASVVLTNQQIAQINSQKQVTGEIQTGVSNLGYLSNDYFLYQDSAQVTSWQSQFSTLFTELSKINSTNPAQQTLINNVQTDMQRLNTVFNGAVTFIQSVSRNESIRVLPAFQTAWSRLALQNQALAFDTTVLTKSYDAQANQAILVNSILTFALLGAIGAYFVSVYYIIYRRTLKSISQLQDGTKIIGSGNLNYSIEPKGNDEVAELSQAFNQMTVNLRTVTASKVELEYAQTQLRESEQRWATTLASIGDAVIATDLYGKVVFMNGVAEELTGWTLTEASSKFVKEVFNIVNEQTRLRVEDPVEKVLEKGMIVGLANHTVLVRKDGTDLPIDDSGAPIVDKEGKITGVVLIFRDITERKQAETKLDEYAKNLEGLVEQRTKALKNSERLAAIGATAGMVGHDIRNPLQAITSDVFLVKSDLESVPECAEKVGIKESLDGIEQNVDYINKIVQDLQDFARPLNPKTEESDIKQVIETLLAKNGLPENIKVSVKVAEDAKKVSADSYYLTRILSNLITNSVQAMPNGGKLTIKSYKDLKDVVIAVKDTGVGIPDELRNKMFTLMFTTKSKGQGFGLPVVKRMTESLGGTVTFESQEGEGTTFIIRLPNQKN